MRIISKWEIQTARPVRSYTKRTLSITAASLQQSGGSAVAVYDLVRGAYMMRNGFTAHDVCARGDTLYILNGKRHVCRFGEGRTYDGIPIAAHWQTPLTDLHEKGCVKCMRELYLRGSSELPDSVILMDMTVGKNTAAHRIRVPDTRDEVSEVPLVNEGRTFSMRFYNEAGGHFSLTGGAELSFDNSHFESGLPARFSSSGVGIYKNGDEAYISFERTNVWSLFYAGSYDFVAAKAAVTLNSAKAPQPTPTVSPSPTPDITPSPSPSAVPSPAPSDPPRTGDLDLERSAGFLIVSVLIAAVILFKLKKQ